jgi:hypothetical protein
MSMIDPKGSVIAAPDGIFLPLRDRFPVEKVIHDAIVDVEDGVKFWKTLGGHRRAKRGSSSEFLNRNG